MKLIVESGATKSDWRLVTDCGEQVGRFMAEGMNVSTMSVDRVSYIISRTARCVTAAAAGNAVREVYFYTAGVITDEIEAFLTSVLGSVFAGAEVEIQNDLVAAARALCGHEPGIAAILGTGSNSCLYDGEKIVRRIYSSGFILGDEGSAATLGKLFIADFLKGLVPEYIAEDFASRYPSDYASIIGNVYKSGGSPSGYLGGFAPFIMEYYRDPYIKELVDGNFRAFFTRSIKRYGAGFSVGIAGGFGYALKDIIVAVAQQEGVHISKFMRSPIEGLIEYHI